MNHIKTAITVAAIAGVTALGLTACGGRPLLHIVKPAHTPAASASPQAADQCAALRQWARGPRGQRFLAVGSDNDKLKTDLDAGDNVTAATDAARLVSDATLAAATPPPVGATEYAAAMRADGGFGSDVLNGDVVSAGAHVQAVVADLKAWEAAVTATGCVPQDSAAPPVST